MRWEHPFVGLEFGRYIALAAQSGAGKGVEEMPASVLLVCNDGHALCAWSSALELSGCTVARFTDSMQALDALDAIGSVQVLVTSVDFGPGKLNGVALARMARYRRPSVRVIITGPPGIAHLADGVAEFRAFPLDGRELARTIGQWLAPPAVD